MLVPGERIADPVGARIGSEEAEQRAEREMITVLQRDRLELAVGAVQCGDLAAIAHGDAVAVELADEVVGHRLAKVGTPV